MDVLYPDCAGLDVHKDTVVGCVRRVRNGRSNGRSAPSRRQPPQRNLLRTRKQLVRERSRHIQRIQRTLEDANIKLDSVISDILGVSGRAMIEALIGGETALAKLAAPGRPADQSLAGGVARSLARQSDHSPPVSAAPSSQADRRNR